MMSRLSPSSADKRLRASPKKAERRKFVALSSNLLVDLKDARPFDELQWVGKLFESGAQRESPSLKLISVA